ncbi:hypothetical protein LCGC14_1076040 [marine sediment metagenome]|uniref:site-specific DNA-methyltransferase (adenine-specific) n=1 Tax=marine sediment metagenome TaxID=412755 RepID=A0A0F9MLJ2_9ZZZZ
MYNINRDTLSNLAEINKSQIKPHGSKKKVEANVRLKVVIPFFEALGWNKISDIEAEFPVRNKRVDLCLLIKGFPKLLIEIKDIDEDLDKHVKQATDYVFDLESSVDKVILANGDEFRFYKCDIITKTYKKILEWKRDELSNEDRQNEIIALISKKHLSDEIKQERLDETTLEIFIKKFNHWKILLFNSLSQEIHYKYAKNEDFKEKIDKWVNFRPELSLEWTWKDETDSTSMNDYFSKALNQELKIKVTVTKSNESKFWKQYKNPGFKQEIHDALRNSGIAVDLFDKFALESAYLFLIRILFLRMAEDFGFIPYKILTPSWIMNFYKYRREKSIYHQICSCLSEIDYHFPIIYKYPLFDNIYFKDLTWSKVILIKIIEEIILFDFSTSESDLIGKIYEKSIDKNTRKLLGKFYTDPIIVRFMLSKLEEINEDKTVLDPACGSGTFLKEYYQKVQKLMISKGYAQDDIPDILKHQLWGFDIDPFAVQLTSIKIIIQNFKKAPKERNIYNINSLASKLDDSYKKALNTEKDILSERFDYIFGNPPFFVVNTTEQPYKSIIDTGYYNSIKSSNLNIASMFLYRYILQLKQNGQLVFIFPRSMLHINSFENVRKEVLKKKIQYIYDLGKAFEDVGLEQIIVIVKNDDYTDNIIHYGLLNLESTSKEISELIQYEIDQDYIINNKNLVFEVFSGNKTGHPTSGRQIKEKLLRTSNGKNVNDYCTKIQRGLGYQKYAYSKRRNSDDLIIIGGRSIFNYGKKGTETYRYIPKNKVVKAKMSQKASINLYSPKIMLQRLVTSKIRIVGCYDNEPIDIKERFNIQVNKNEKIKIFTLSFDTILTLYLKEEKYARYLLAVLTSELATYYLRDFVFIRQTLTIDLDTIYLEKIPIVEPTDVQLEEITELIKKLEIFVENGQEKSPVSERKRPDWENPEDNLYQKYSNLIDQLNEKIYDLYGLDSTEKDFIKAQINEFDDYY